MGPVITTVAVAVPGLQLLASVLPPQFSAGPSLEGAEYRYEVSQATCWIDQADSYLGYTSNVCQVWLEGKLAELTTKRDAAGRFARIFQNMIDGYSKCAVSWEQPAAPLVDISDFSRDSAGSSSYPTVGAPE